MAAPSSESDTNHPGIGSSSSRLALADLLRDVAAMVEQNEFELQPIQQVFCDMMMYCQSQGGSPGFSTNNEGQHPIQSRSSNIYPVKEENENSHPQPKLSIKEMKAIAESNGVDVHGMERAELQDLVSKLQQQDFVDLLDTATGTSEAETEPSPQQPPKLSIKEMRAIAEKNGNDVHGMERAELQNLVAKCQQQEPVDLLDTASEEAAKVPSPQPQPKLSVKEMKAIAEKSGIDVHGMERTELDGLVATIQQKQQSTVKPPAPMDDRHEQSAQEQQEAQRRKRAEAEKQEADRRAVEAQAKREKEQRETERRAAEAQTKGEEEKQKAERLAAEAQAKREEEKRAAERRAAAAQAKREEEKRATDRRAAEAQAKWREDQAKAAALAAEEEQLQAQEADRRAAEAQAKKEEEERAAEAYAKWQEAQARLSAAAAEKERIRALEVQRRAAEEAHAKWREEQTRAAAVAAEKERVRACEANRRAAEETKQERERRQAEYQEWLKKQQEKAWADWKQQHPQPPPRPQPPRPQPQPFWSGQQPPQPQEPQPQPPPPPSQPVSTTTLKHTILSQWALRPPALQFLRPIHALLTGIHKVFPPALGVPGHEAHFAKWKSLKMEDMVGNSGQPDEGKLNKATKKLRFVLHPDKLPRGLNEQQSMVCKMLWDITSDAWEEYKKSNDDLDWLNKSQ